MLRKAAATEVRRPSSILYISYQLVEKVRGNYIMLWKHDRPAESHIKVNGKTKNITFVLLEGYREFYYAFLPFLAKTKAQLFIITFLFLPFHFKTKALFEITVLFLSFLFQNKSPLYNYFSFSSFSSWKLYNQLFRNFSFSSFSFKNLK